MTYRPYPNPTRARHQLDRHAQASTPTAVADALRSLSGMSQLIRQAYIRTNASRIVIDLPPRDAAQPKPVITIQGDRPDASRHWSPASSEGANG